MSSSDITPSTVSSGVGRAKHLIIKKVCFPPAVLVPNLQVFALHSLLHLHFPPESNTLRVCFQVHCTMSRETIQLPADGSVEEALESFRGKRGDTAEKFLVIGYSDKNTLCVVASGEGGLTEASEHVIEKDTRYSKFLFLFTLIVRSFCWTPSFALNSFRVYIYIYIFSVCVFFSFLLFFSGPVIFGPFPFTALVSDIFVQTFLWPICNHLF